MKKSVWIMVLVAILIVGGIVYFYKSKNNSGSNYSAEKSSLNKVSNTTNSTNNTSNSISNNTSNSTSNNVATNNTTNSTITKTTVEKEIASYSTKIQNKKDTNRQGNITITCSSLNNTIVKAGETFSFCNTVGQSTIDKGYKEANVIIQGTETKGLGGGNCQVSSTLYNAVLVVPNELEVVERHAHSAPVPYIEEGKDAAVSYRYT